MTRRTLGLVVVAFLLGLSSSAVAARQYMSYEQSSIRQLTERLDWLSAKVNAGRETGLRSWLDYGVPFVDPTSGHAVSVVGWGVSCQAGASGYPQAIDIAIDHAVWTASDAPFDFRTAVGFWFDRADVRAAYWMWPTCVPAAPGLFFTLDTEDLAPGQHTLAMRLWDTNTGMSQWSNPLAFTR